MNKVILCFLLLCTVSFVNAQYVPTEEPNSKGNNVSLPGKKVYPIYLGLGTGIYGKYGYLGLSAAVRLAPQLLAEVNAGLGGWGTKMGVSFTGLVKNTNAWCPNIGFTRNSGIQGVELTSAITYKGGTTEIDYTGKHNFSPVNILHLGVQRQWLSGRGNRIILELGYSLALNEPTVTLETTGVIFNNQFIPVEDITFSETQQTVYNILAPNGLMINFAYQFGLGSAN